MTVVIAPPQPTNASLLDGFRADAELRGLSAETLSLPGFTSSLAMVW